MLSLKQELVHISVLYEDRWLGAAQEIRAMMPSRVRLLEHELRVLRIPSDDREEVRLERYQLIMAPVLELLTALESTVHAARTQIRQEIWPAQ